MIARIRHFIASPEGISSAGNIAGSLLGLAGFYFITRSFSTDALGQWFLFLAGSTLADMLRIGLVNNGFIYHVSGTEGRERQTILGSGILLFAFISGMIALVITSAPLLFPGITAEHSSWRLFFLWYPLFAVVSVPHNAAEWIAQSQRTFGRVAAIRITIRGGLLVCAAVNFYYHIFSIEQLAISFLAVNGAASLWALSVKWLPLTSLKHGTLTAMRELLRFGRFNSLTQVGANLLRSSDTFFLGSSLGPAAVARYAVPAKLLELVELPLRSFGAAAFPAFSKAHRAGDLNEMKRLFIKNVSLLTAAILPPVLICAVWADTVAGWFGGAQFRDAGTILQFFLAYCLLIPFDRFSGIFIDSLNKPQYNSMKVWLMLAVNCAADLTALAVFGTPESVAAASLVTFTFGSVLNIIIIHRLTGWNIRPHGIMSSSLRAITVTLKGPQV